MVRVLLILLSLFLSGCGSERERELAQALEQQRGVMEAKIAELERRAAVAQACDWLVPVCPASMTTPGKEAIKHGYSGGGGLFWALAAGKLAALLIPLGLAIGAGGWAWARLSRPALDEAEAARRTITEAEARTERARQMAAAWSEKAKAAQAEAEAAEKRAAEAARQIEEARSEAGRLAEARRLLTGL